MVQSGSSSLVVPTGQLPIVGLVAGILLRALRDTGLWLYWEGMESDPHIAWLPEDGLTGADLDYVQAHSKELVHALMQETASWQQRLAHTKPRRGRAPSTAYNDYLRSPAWLAFRRFALAEMKHQCQRCHATGTLQVHHLHYDTIAEESMEDVEVLCVPCHALADAERKQQNRIAALARRQDAAYRRLNGWACKVYGDDWEDDPGYEEAEEAFQDWLADRGEG